MAAAGASVTGKGSQPVYLVDFAVYRPPEKYNAGMYQVYETAIARDLFPGHQEFMLKVAEKSGIGYRETYLPHAINPTCNSGKLMNDMGTSMLEAEAVMCGAVGELLERTGLKPSDIDIVITNCSIFCPTPSLSSMLVHKFGLRSDIQSYSLGGMGCSNGVVSIGLVRDLLQARPNTVALFVPAEITTYCFYQGAHKQYTVANSLFRTGGAAALLSNKAAYARTAKYTLQYNVRVHTGQDEESYGCMSWGPDPDCTNGVYLGKNVPKCAAAALMACLKRLSPYIMTWGQYASAVNNYLTSKFTPVEPYKPDFTQCVQHFALHAGGYAVLKGLQKGMQLPTQHMLPSFATLRDYGNTSCSTTWYVMAYLESVVGVKRGERVMQVGLGGGMKAGINIWVANRHNHQAHCAWAHLQGKPITPADLPRPIDDPKSADGTISPAAAAAAADAAAAHAEARTALALHKAAAAAAAASAASAAELGRQLPGKLGVVIPEPVIAVRGVDTDELSTSPLNSPQPSEGADLSAEEALERVG